MYEYLDRKPEAGDIVECQEDNSYEYTKGKLYISKGFHEKFPKDLAVELDDNGSTTNGWHYSNFKVVKTLSGDQAKVGDTCIRVGKSLEDSPKGATFIVTHIYDGKIGYKKHHLTYPVNIRVLCLAETKPKAYYKRSGEPWTTEELKQIPNMWRIPTSTITLTYKWVYPTASGSHEYYLWDSQRPARYPQEYTLVAFEDEFNISSLGAQSEPTQSIIKESTMNFQELINSIFQDKIQTDYDKKPDYLVVIYNNEGTEIAQATAGSIQSVEDKIQATPKLWGAKAVCYKIDTEVQTQVPVTSTKIKKSK